MIQIYLGELAWQGAELQCSARLYVRQKSGLLGMHYADCSQAPLDAVSAALGPATGVVPGSSRGRGRFCSRVPTLSLRDLASHACTASCANFEQASEWLKANLHPMYSSKFNV